MGQQKEQTMLRQITTMIVIILFISIAQANTIYSGENFEYRTDLDEIITWRVINNNTFINATQTSNKTINISIHELSEALSFSLEIKGYKNEEERIVYIPSSGGGSSRIVYKNNTLVTFLNKTEYVDKIVEKEVYIEKESSEEDRIIPIRLWIILGLIALIYLILTIFLLSKVINKKEVDDGTEINLYNQK
jgi:hypothetical protein